MQPIKVTQVSCHDQYGGAEKIALTLHEGYQIKKHQSWLLVGNKKTQQDNVLKINNPAFNSLQSLQNKIQFTNKKISVFLNNPQIVYHKIRERFTGSQLSRHTSTQFLLEQTPDFPDLLHLHNLHGHYFDLHQLSTLSHRLPTIITLHDMWLLAGYCIHSLDCNRWKFGCGECPQIQQKLLQKDGSFQDWQLKQNIYQQSKLYIVTPSQWLMDQVHESSLQPAIIKSKVIPNGIDTQIFRPANQEKVRYQLKLDLKAKIVLFAATSIKKNKLKGYSSLKKVIDIIAQADLEFKIIFLALGEKAPTEIISDHAEIQFMPYQSNPRIVAEYYQASDVYLHITKAEVFGLVITEAMACQLPVVATNVGGIPEQIIDGHNGYLIPPDDPETAAKRIMYLLQNPDQSRAFGENGLHRVHREFSQSIMIDRYLDFYDDILER